MKNSSKIFFLGILLMLLYFGCKKDQSKSATGSLPVQTVATVSIPDGMLLTPQGLMPKANVHLVENGYHLELRAGHVFEIKTATGEMKEDFGAIRVAAVSAPKSSAGSVAQNGMGRTDVTSQPNGNNWKTYAEYPAGSGSLPIGLCQSTWAVPAAPSTSGAQIYIGNGVENNAHSNSSANLVIEPALLYGYNGDPNTSSTGWTISNWCSWNGGAAYTTPIAVSAGTNLTGIVTLTNYVSPNYQYTCAFNGYSNPLTVLYNSTQDVTGTAMPLIPIENYAFESLQAYGLTSFNQYPNQASVNMTNILVETGTAGSGGSFTTPQSLLWNYFSTAQAVYGEHTIIGPNTTQTNPTPNTTGEVQLWFRYASPCITIPAGSGPGGVYQTCAGTPITTTAPVSTCGGGITYTFSPATPPTGVTYNSNGTVTAGASTAAGTYNFTITATNTGGSSSGNATIVVLTSTVLTYSSYEFHQGATVNITPTTTGSPVTSCSSIPSLTNIGLTLHPNGTITGTATPASAAVNYTITYSNGSCSGTAVVSIAVDMPFYIYNNILEYSYNGTQFPNTGYGSTFAYFYNSSNGQLSGPPTLTVSSINRPLTGPYSTTPNPAIAWVPPGNYNVTLSPQNGPHPDPTDSFTFNGGGPSGPGPGNTFNNVNISPSGINTVTINN